MFEVVQLMNSGVREKQKGVAIQTLLLMKSPNTRSKESSDHLLSSILV